MMILMITVDEINNTKFHDKIKFGKNVLIGKNVFYRFKLLKLVIILLLKKMLSIGRQLFNWLKHY